MLEVVWRNPHEPVPGADAGTTERSLFLVQPDIEDKDSDSAVSDVPVVH
jgi:hypothetical protein